MPAEVWGPPRASRVDVPDGSPRARQTHPHVDVTTGVRGSYSTADVTAPRRRAPDTSVLAALDVVRPAVHGGMRAAGRLGLALANVKRGPFRVEGSCIVVEGSARLSRNERTPRN